MRIQDILPEENYNNEPPRVNKKHAPLKVRGDFNEDMLYPETIKTKGYEEDRKHLKKELKKINNKTQQTIYP
jgi:hypothetical protein